MICIVLYRETGTKAAQFIIFLWAKASNPHCENKAEDFA
jgi:hypothetical protein